MPYLAYERTGGNKVIATIWQVDQYRADNGKSRDHIVLKEITEEEAKLTINELKEKYPFTVAAPAAPAFQAEV